MSRFWKLICIAVLGLAAGWGSTASQAAQPTAPDQPEAALRFIQRWVYENRDQVGAALGSAVSGLGDVNGDGFADVMVGAEKYALSVELEGAAFAFYGSAGGLPALPGWSVGGGLKGSRYGSAVAAAGDVNHDGYDDALVGANRFNHDHPEEGAAYLYYGSGSGLQSIAAWQFESNQKNATLGSALAGAGLVNDDLYADVIIGAPLYEVITTTTNEGAAFAFYGSGSGLSNTPDWVAHGGQGGALFGAAVSAAGDVNGDGWGDVIIGAPQYRVPVSVTLVHMGAAFVFYGSETGLLDTPAWVVTGSSAEAQFGASVAGVGDVNDDNFADVLVGAPFASLNEDSGQVGAAYLYLGSAAGLAEIPAWTVYGSQAGAQFGAVVGSAGDLDENEAGDVFVSAPLQSDDQSAEGAVFVYLSPLSGVLDLPAGAVYGDKTDTLFGAAAANAGDVNKDGQPELIVGAPLFKMETNVMGRGILFTSRMGGWDVFIPFILR